MKPERKLMLTAAVLIAAACAFGSRPAAGLDDQGDSIMKKDSIFKQSALQTRS